MVGYNITPNQELYFCPPSTSSFGDRLMEKRLVQQAVPILAGTAACMAFLTANMFLCCGDGVCPGRCGPAHIHWAMTAALHLQGTQPWPHRCTVKGNSMLNNYYRKNVWVSSMYQLLRSIMVLPVEGKPATKARGAQEKYY